MQKYCIHGYFSADTGIETYFQNTESTLLSLTSGASSSIICCQRWWKVMLVRASPGTWLLSGHFSLSVWDCRQSRHRWAELKSSKICKILLTVHLLLLLYQWNPIKPVKWNMTERHVWTTVLSWKVSNLGLWEHNNKIKTHTSLHTQNAQSLQVREPSTTMPVGAAVADLPAHTGWGGQEGMGCSAHFSFMFLNCCLVKVNLLKNMTR